MEREKFLKFLHSIATIFFRPNVSEFLELQKYGQSSDYYRLSCLRQILFLMHCFACFDETIDFIGGISNGEVII